VDIFFGARRIVSFSGTDAISRADELLPRLNAFMDSKPELYDVAYGEPGVVLARRRPLFRVTSEDATASKLGYEDLQRDVLKNLKTAIYGLAYKVWDSR
jgi:hypothetical protein